jgi:hypothetical protein
MAASLLALQFSGISAAELEKEAKNGRKLRKMRLLLLRSRTFGGDQFSCEREALTAARLAAEAAIGAGRAGRAFASGLADVGFANRVADADDHDAPVADNAKRSQ